MAKKKKETVEFRFYELPKGNLPLCFVVIAGFDRTDMMRRTFIFIIFLKLESVERVQETWCWMRRLTDIRPIALL